MAVCDSSSRGRVRRRRWALNGGRNCDSAVSSAEQGRQAGF